ncbi:MAG: hypothetical protein ACYTFA_06700 [Planctomycetota bacterium]|jgi:outer membrane lipoprotein-sorting protein
MKKVSVLLSLCLAIGIATPVAGQTETGEADVTKKDPTPNKAIEILKKVDAATKAVKLVRYKAERRATGWLAERTPPIDGTVVIAGDCPDARPERFRFEAKFKVPDSEETKEVTAGSDGDISFLIDPSVKTVYADIDPAVVGSDGRLAGFLAMIEYCHPTPFNDEITGERAELKGMTKIGDQNCYEIDVLYAGGRGESTWFFSEKDFLPRRVDRIATRPGGERASTQLTLTDVDVDPKFKHDPFKVVVPEGFTKTDEFAPSRRRMPR